MKSPQCYAGSFLCLFAAGCKHKKERPLVICIQRVFTMFYRVYSVYTVHLTLHKLSYFNVTLGCNGLAYFNVTLNEVLTRPQIYEPNLATLFLIVNRLLSSW